MISKINKKECLNMNENIFITINCLNMFYGKKPFKIGRVVRLVKEPGNEYDKEAIYAELPYIEKIGYVANSIKTVYEGTYSAGRVYDKFDDYAYAQIMFVTHSCAIAILLSKEEVESDDDEQEQEKPRKSTSHKKKDSANPVGFKG